MGSVKVADLSYETDERRLAARAARSRINRCTSCSRPLEGGVCIARGLTKEFLGGAGTAVATGRATGRGSCAASGIVVLIRLP